MAIAEAEKNESDEEIKEEIKDFHLFILENQSAFLDYREILKDKGFDVTGMRTMVAAESNMNLFSRRLKKYGYSWSFDGLDKMVGSMIHRFEGNLIKAIKNIKSTTVANEKNKEPAKYPSFASLLTEKTRQSIGAIQGHLPALAGDDHGKPYIRALRGLAGLLTDNEKATAKLFTIDCSAQFLAGDGKELGPNQQMLRIDLSVLCLLEKVCPLGHYFTEPFIFKSNTDKSKVNCGDLQIKMKITEKRVKN